ncbi:MAG: 1-acyl-sn-glycerol-3-phosphate acyltransferase [Acidimicrobiaceae bacterium]|nr:1-acyl-sn-glycerol-3-phosphate acyltransferase [Acidimicrobiaceae bacterium]
MSEEPKLNLNTRKDLGYRVVAGLISGLSSILFRPEVTGAQNIPLTGPVLIAPIHRSNVDFAFTLFISPRKVFFMAKVSVFRVPLLGPLLLHLGAFPVKRGSADRESMSLAEEVLRLGHALVLFPEGTRKEGLSVAPLHDGAMFVAARTGALVVPVGIGGSDRAMPKGAKLPRPAKIKIVVGEPISPPTSDGRIPRSAITAKSEELREALERVYRSSLED